MVRGKGVRSPRVKQVDHSGRQEQDLPAVSNCWVPWQALEECRGGIRFIPNGSERDLVGANRSNGDGLKVGLKDEKNGAKTQNIVAWKVIYSVEDVVLRWSWKALRHKLIIKVMLCSAKSLITLLKNTLINPIVRLVACVFMRDALESKVRISEIKQVPSCREYPYSLINTRTEQIMSLWCGVIDAQIA